MDMSLYCTSFALKKRSRSAVRNKLFIAMSNWKNWRVLKTHPETGEVRCNDPSCCVTQCAPCNKEQSRLKREAKKAELQKLAAAEKERQQEAEREQARLSMPVGGHVWTYDREEIEDAAAAVILRMEHAQQDHPLQRSNIDSNQEAICISDNDFEPPKKRKSSGAVKPATVATSGTKKPKKQSPARAAAPMAPSMAAHMTASVPDAPADDAPPEVTSASDQDCRTKWNHVTRTMLFKCIQHKDPFFAEKKAETWDAIAKAMTDATKHLKDDPDGDLQVHANGRSMQVFYNRCKAKRKSDIAGDQHSGGAGKDVTPARQEEMNQLQACMDLEKSAKDVQEKKREAVSAHEKLSKGEVNDFIVETAISDDRVRPKLVKVLASRLREAKLRKLAFEQTHKGAQYTYTATDLENFQHYEKVKQACPDVKDIDEAVESSGAGASRGGALANAIQGIVDKLPRVEAMTPMSPTQFAEAFFKAKRASVTSLRDKLLAVDADHADGLLSAEEVQFYKNKIKEAHYLGAT
jgi:hypothetical protein